jgi:acyl homoserine lactone synthase
MDIVVARCGQTNETSQLLEQMFRLRTRVFRDRLAWKVTVRDGYEFDEFDGLHADYLLAVTKERVVVGCARLLPASGPTMLQTVFPILLSKGVIDASTHSVESSRFCVDADIGRANPTFLHNATLSLFCGIIEWSILHGYSEIVTATDLRFERLLRHAGWPMQRLGQPHMIGNVNSVAGRLLADPAVLSRLRPLDYRLRDLVPVVSSHARTSA